MKARTINSPGCSSAKDAVGNIREKRLPGEVEEYKMNEQRKCSNPYCATLLCSRSTSTDLCKACSYIRNVGYQKCYGMMYFKIKQLERKIKEILDGQVSLKQLKKIVRANENDEEIPLEN